MKFLISFTLLILGLVTGGCHGFICEEENFLGITTHISCPRDYDSRDAQFCCGSKENRICCSNPLGFDEDELEELASNSLTINKRAATHAVTPTEGPISPQTVVTQEGFRDNVRKTKDKVKQKLNSTMAQGKDKAKKKVQEKVLKKVGEKLAWGLPAIVGTIFAVALTLVIVCIVCCCCCPFCMLYKRRSAGVVHNPNPGQATTMPVMNAAPPTQPGYAPIQTGPYPPTSQPYPPQTGYAPPPQGYMPQPQPGYGPPPTGAPYPISNQMGPSDNPPPYAAEKQMAYNPNY